MLTITTALPEEYRTATPEALAARIGAARAALGDRLLILGHHYQKDEVMRWADARGDSFGLSRLAADRHDAEFVVFCGVHFMAESADVLTGPDQQVLLPDLAAGCSMADMADIDQVEEAWTAIGSVADLDRVVPITYMNSTAALKAFVGRHGGAVCTSSNARRVLEWALSDQPDRRAAEKVLFFPDQHLGRNTALAMGFDPASMVVWDPRRDLGGLADVEVKEATFLLWRGHCSVHQRFKPGPRGRLPRGAPRRPGRRAPRVLPRGRRGRGPGGLHRLHHPHRGRRSPGDRGRDRDRDPPGQAARRRAPDLTVECLDPSVCPCSTMSRIDAPHLAWLLEELAEGRVRNRITVDEATATWARVALERMLSIV